MIMHEGIMRFPNTECGFLGGLFDYFPYVRRRLGITTGKLTWEFLSTATRKDEIGDTGGKFVFNVMKGKFDQHGNPKNQELCRVCSLDLVRESYDFLQYRSKWLEEIFELVRANDISGERISRHPFNLRELMTALSYNYKNDPQLVLDWLSLAFCGVFKCCEAGILIEDVFNPEEMVKGVTLYSPQQLEWFEELLHEAISTIKQHRYWANKAIKAAESRGRFATINIPSVGKVKVVEVFCDSFKTGAAGRQAGYQIVIQWNQDGHCQIHGGHLKEKSEESVTKKWVHMGEVAKELRFLEAKFRGRKIKDGQDWTANDFILFAENDTAIPWYLPEFLTSLYNGTMSSADISPTVIGRRKIFEAVCRSLPRCLAVIKVNNNDRKIVSQPELVSS